MKEPAHDDERLSARDGQMDERERDKPAYDDERLSALLDGRLNEREREELLAHLEVPGEDYEVLARTAAMLREMEEEDASPEDDGPVHGHPFPPGTEPEDREEPPPEPSRPRLVSERTSRRGGPGTSDPDDNVVEHTPPARIYPLPPRRGRWARRSLSALAVLALAFAGGLFIRGRPRVGADPVVLAMALESGAKGLPAGGDGKPWSVPRSGGGSVVRRSAESVRTGARLVDLAVAVRARDAVETRAIAGEIQSPYTSIPVFERIIARAGAPADSLRPLLAEGTTRMEKFLNREDVRLGAWVEAARLAAATNDTAFFRARATGSPPARAEQLAQDNKEVRDALDGVLDALSAGSPAEWAKLSTALDGLMGILAN